ncbi:DNA-binding LacI/PurR family transcriptional regulator [Kibdelosporangium banguiense]|uniref:DNA-binding LacI/PurR family transcriptional regulator n=1 Tax=Kibdelosporangium banguiense TaxID=1365924 RepID=A0ABS4TAT4_9PSEU|nr:LacI family DNA-binding transcriptional regulator [Kibdelosporangium banguiense]MBP2321523.1 DNA-binding LacI/PurR family transcriptional regulator [Kibdelosporangium banguiense]
MGSTQDRPTLEDVAAYAGVSRSTASRALNEETYVSPKAREAVLAAAKDLGYSPNQAARSLVTKRTGAVALVLSEPETKVLDDPYYPTVMRAAFRELASRGSQMLVMFVDTRDDIPRTMKFLDGGHVDGALVIAPHGGDPLPTALRLLRVPVVFGGRPGSKGLYTVDYDNVSGARLAVEHLIGLGRRRIVTVSGSVDHPAAQDRITGWRETLAERGLKTAGLAVSGDFTHYGGEVAMTRLLELEPKLDGVFAASDPMAVGALRALRAAGRRVPQDVAVVGFDDNPSLATATDPPLTSVHQEPGEQVRRMISMLMAMLAGEPPQIKREVLPVSLTIRASTQT